MKSNRAQWGFTLIELMVTVVLAATVLTLGVPNFREMIQQNRVAAASNSFVTALHYARSEAIKRGLRVSVCKSSDTTTCTTSGGWEQGWIIFQDDGATVGQVDTGEVIFRASRSLSAGMTLRGNNNVANRISFHASGFGGGTNGQVILCDGRVQNFATDKGKARLIIISQTGRIRLEKGDFTESGLTALTSCTP